MKLIDFDSYTTSEIYYSLLKSPKVASPWTPFADSFIRSYHNALYVTTVAVVSSDYCWTVEMSDGYSHSSNSTIEMLKQIADLTLLEKNWRLCNTYIINDQETLVDMDKEDGL